VNKNKKLPVLRALDNFAAQLLEEAGLAMPAGAIDTDSFIQLFRSATEVLAARAARLDGKALMTAKEVAMMCRSTLSCLTLREAVGCAGDFMDMLAPRAGAISLRVDGEIALFTLDTQRKAPSRTSCLVDTIGLHCFVQLFSWLIGENLRLRTVTLGYPNREDAAPFLHLFGAPVYVGGSHYLLEFDARQLARPVLRRAEELGEFLRTFPYNVIGNNPHSPPLYLQVRACIDAALARGAPLPTPDVLAELVGASEATLRRRLHAEGTSYSNLRDLSLREAAERYLLRTSWTVDHIAGQLGFSDGITFRRAFRRWTGSTPNEIRKKMPGA
jgi:AraC-like DNA-binding protein